MSVMIAAVYYWLMVINCSLTVLYPSSLLWKYLNSDFVFHMALLIARAQQVVR